MYGSEKNMGHFTEGVKNIVSHTLFKTKIREWPQRIVYVVYVKRAYKTLDFLSYLCVHILFCKLKYFKHIQESVEVVIDS